MKHGNTYYMELPRDIFHPVYADMSKNAKWLFIILNELEHRFAGDYEAEDEDFFIRRTDQKLCEDTGFSICTLKKAKAELKQYPELVQIWRGHWHYKQTGKSDIKQPTCYRIIAGTQDNPKIAAYNDAKQDEKTQKMVDEVLKKHPEWQ